MTVLFLCLFAVSIIYCLFIHFFCMKKEWVILCARIFRYTSLSGAAVGMISFIIYYVRTLTLDKALAETVRDAYEVCALPALIFTAVIFAATACAHFLRQSFAPSVPYICHLGAMVVLLWTLIYASWSHYESFELTVYIELTGIALALLLLFPASLCYNKFALRFDDKEFMKIRKYGDPKRLARQQEKQHIRETKARIKNQTKRK